MEPASQQPSRMRKTVRTVAVVGALSAAILILLELSLALFGVAPARVEQDPYVGFSNWFPLFVEETDPSGEPVMVTAPNKLDLFNDQRFQANKPEDVCRVFCMGGSTTYGRPFRDPTSFCGWLRLMLPKADPTRQWEVVNAGGISYASYRVVRLMEELSQYEPDLFIVYTGHNEFLEERTYRDARNQPVALEAIIGLLSHTRTFALARRIAHSRDPGAGDRYQLPGEVDAILDHSIGPEAYHRDDALREDIVAHFEQDLARMLDVAQSCGAGILFIVPASNLRDSSPFKSTHREDLSPPDKQRWDDFFEQGIEACARGQWAEALASFDGAATLDPRHAGVQYRRGRVLWTLGRHEEALEAFQRALEEDVCPLRATSAIRAAVVRIANQRGVPLVDFAAMVEDAAPYRTPGDDLFLDHVHPTIETHEMLASAILDKLIQQGFLHAAPAWNETEFADVHREILDGLDDQVRSEGLRNLAKVLGWAGKSDEAHRLALMAVELCPEDAEAQYQAGQTAHQMGLLPEAEQHFADAVRLDFGHARARMKLANLWSEQGASDKALDEYRALLDAEPQIAAMAYNNLGNEFAARAQTDNAIAHYQKALELRPDYADAQSNWGLVLAGLGKQHEAADHYRSALRSDPNNLPANYNLGVLLSKEGRYAEGIPLFRRAAKHAPHNATVQFYLGKALVETDEAAEALEYLRAALRLQPNFPAALAAAAQALMANPNAGQEDLTEAVRLAERAVELTYYQDEDCLDVLAAAYRACGKEDEATALGKTRQSAP